MFANQVTSSNLCSYSIVEYNWVRVISGWTLGSKLRMVQVHSIHNTPKSFYILNRHNHHHHHRNSHRRHLHHDNRSNNSNSNSPHRHSFFYVGDCYHFQYNSNNKAYHHQHHYFYYYLGFLGLYSVVGVDVHNVHLIIHLPFVRGVRVVFSMPHFLLAAV